MRPIFDCYITRLTHRNVQKKKIVNDENMKIRIDRQQVERQTQSTSNERQRRKKTHFFVHALTIVPFVGDGSSFTCSCQSFRKLSTEKKRKWTENYARLCSLPSSLSSLPFVVAMLTWRRNEFDPKHKEKRKKKTREKRHSWTITCTRVASLSTRRICADGILSSLHQQVQFKILNGIAQYLNVYRFSLPLYLCHLSLLALFALLEPYVWIVYIFFFSFLFFHFMCVDIVARWRYIFLLLLLRTSIMHRYVLCLRTLRRVGMSTWREEKKNRLSFGLSLKRLHVDCSKKRARIKRVMCAHASISNARKVWKKWIEIGSATDQHTISVWIWIRLQSMGCNWPFLLPTDNFLNLFLLSVKSEMINE